MRVFWFTFNIEIWKAQGITAIISFMEKVSWTHMAYSIHSHIFCILEASSKNPNDFSLIGRKLNEILQFKYKSLMVLKLKPEINFKIMQKGSKIIKIMKGSKNKRVLTSVKTIFLHINEQEILINYNTKEIHAKKILFLACCTFWASHWHIKCKINWERIFKYLHSWAISFWDSVKKFIRSHQKWSIEKVVLKNFAIFTGKQLYLSLF